MEGEGRGGDISERVWLENEYIGGRARGFIAVWREDLVGHFSSLFFFFFFFFLINGIVTIQISERSWLTNSN